MSFDQARARHRRFWEPLAKGEGGYLAVASPKSDTIPQARIEPPKDLNEKWLSPEYAVKRAEISDGNTFFGLDAFHSEFVNLGPGSFAAVLGAPYKLQPDSIWFDLDPPIKSWDPAPSFEIDTENALYQVIETRTRALCEASKGRYAVSFTDIGGQLDILFSLRGEELLSDMIECPEAVLDAEYKIDTLFLEYFNTLKNIIGPSGCGYTNWIPLLNDDPWYPLQCDLSVMISPAMFEKFVLPALDRVSAAIGQSVYHLDGPGEIAHLDMLLSLPHVHAIQWVPLPTAGSAAKARQYQDFSDAMSLDIYRRSLAAGKKVVLLGVRPNQIPTIFDAVGTDGVFIATHCEKRADADALVETAQKQWIKR